ncbi:MAG: DUF418 domain-containing protein [Brevundimonas sp.]|uniref:DUF418 domain-containing protein n=1 Tax=Brevundimonas sp. TaxID=1871086 RepID=UPI002718CCA8|nr:DUF418 domain-containing protein [Brevundimonas sp.]MDO9589242.1 DUF418 domain-containing protein [Brevundimonas sp.]MDP3655452.1 DUF418 domain-containing protein [Brevundimonas sp.]MDZ4112031.1 DUF418 domain-containing protein [Brevundimonas sp.]
MAAVEQTAAGTSAPLAVLAPVAPGDRLFSLDVVRGLAVLGILAVNAMTFAWPWAVSSNPSLQTGFDAEAAQGWQIMHVFFQDKMRTLFSMLFGASIFLIGGERFDAARGKLLRGRLFWLALFGLIHGLAFWFGDILLLYAWTGVFVMMTRSWSARRLLIAGVSLNLVCSALYVGMMSLLAFAPPEAVAQAMEGSGWVSDPASLAEVIAPFHGDALSVTLHVMSMWPGIVPMMLIFFLPATAALMMIGMGLYKVGFLAGRSPAWVYGLFILAGAGSVWLIWRETSGVVAAGFPFIETMTRPYNSLLAPFVSLAYAGILILLARFGLKLILTPLACAGRMAFTNYLSQTLIMTTIFYGGRGLGWYGHIGWPEMWMVIGGVWAAQLIWSPLWLSMFRMGPLEWAWRCLTYKRMVPLRRG